MSVVPISRRKDNISVFLKRTWPSAFAKITIAKVETVFLKAAS